ncbi:hypothetical protein Micbo1qcDRAFT_7839 [Microdochium bolleyi]|uniref:Uncharacterized protein n=1 Tax=Microdochium bolleyi TaxID=196109 RepID=A0A136JJV9_9PEZI|nr:hypothetical protein Micbo1qcDRAFT_7839 [Microdochium bolleyi]
MLPAQQDSYRAAWLQHSETSAPSTGPWRNHRITAPGIGFSVVCLVASGCLALTPADQELELEIGTGAGGTPLAPPLQKPKSLAPVSAALAALWLRTAAFCLAALDKPARSTSCVSMFPSNPFRCSDVSCPQPTRVHISPALRRPALPSHRNHQRLSFSRGTLVADARAVASSWHDSHPLHNHLRPRRSCDTRSYTPLLETSESNPPLRVST